MDSVILIRPGSLKPVAWERRIDVFHEVKIGDNDFSIRIDNQKKEWYFKGILEP